MSNAINNTGESEEAQSLPSSTPEYAPAVQTIVEDVQDGDTKVLPAETTPQPPLPASVPACAPAVPEISVTPVTSATPTAPMTPPTPAVPAVPAAPITPVTPANPATVHAIHGTEATNAVHPSAPNMGVTPEKRLYDMLLEEFSRDPRFELHTNVRTLVQEVQTIRTLTQDGNSPANLSEDLAAIRETVQRIWTRLEEEEKKRREEEKTKTPTPNTQHLTPTQELISETRALVRAVNEEVNVTRNSVIQLTNQMRMVMDTATRCLREMDKTAHKYEAEQQSGELLHELQSLRDMLADGFENARLEPIAPEAGEPFRYGEHRAENGTASSGKIKCTLFPGFRWTQPTPPVVLLPAIVETE